VTLVVGPEARLFACHESVLCHSPYFASLCREQYLEVANKRVDLPDEAPEVLSSVLEYLYKGDYYPRLAHDKKHGTWELEDDGSPKQESTVYHPTSAVYILKVCPFVSSLIRSSSLPTISPHPSPSHPFSNYVPHIPQDTAIYCSADRYGLDELKRLALRKQGLQHGVQCSTILTSARFAYANTPDTDSKLRAHYLALIIRSRATFKRSGTMQMEMEAGGKM
jgi:hypothetical protein